MHAHKYTHTDTLSMACFRWDVAIETNPGADKGDRLWQATSVQNTYAQPSLARGHTAEPLDRHKNWNLYDLVTGINQIHQHWNQFDLFTGINVT